MTEKLSGQISALMLICLALAMPVVGPAGILYAQAGSGMKPADSAARKPATPVPLAPAVPVVKDTVAPQSAAEAASPYTLNGMVSASYSYNFNKPQSRANNFRVFDFDDNSFKIDVLELVAQKAVADPGQAGFRADLTLGASVPRVTASRGLFRGPDGAGADIDLQQAFVSFIAPIGTGLRIDFGKFVTPAGYELIEGYDGYNDNATHSFLFGYAQPSTHTGLRLGYTPSPQFSAGLIAVNGWDVVRDNNQAKTVGAQIQLSSAKGPTVSFVYITGAERDTNQEDVRQLFDIVAVWKLNDRVTLGFNGDFGTEANAAGPGKNAAWRGAAGYAKITLNSKLWIALRGEIFQDADGVRTGLKQALSALTITPEYHPAPNTIVRADLRFDFSDTNIFEGAGGNLYFSQPTFLLNALYVF